MNKDNLIIICDESNNSKSDIEKGIVNCKIGITPTLPMDTYEIEITEDDIRNWIEKKHPELLSTPFESQKDFFWNILSKEVEEMNKELEKE